MPLKKAAKPNGFMMFVMETKRRLEALGERFPGGFDEARDRLAQNWVALSDEQKQIWKQKAKDYEKTEEYAAKRRHQNTRLPKSMRGDAPTESSRRQQKRQVEEYVYVEPIQHFVSI